MITHNIDPPLLPLLLTLIYNHQRQQGKAGVNAFGNAVDVGFQDPDKVTPGDLGFDPLGLAENGINPDYALAEIKHARLAVSSVFAPLLELSPSH